MDDGPRNIQSLYFRVVEPRDDGLDLRHFLGRDFEPRVEGVDQGASDVFAGRLADVGEGLQDRCVDGVGDWRRGHAAGCTAGSLCAGLHRLVRCEVVLGHALSVRFALLWQKRCNLGVRRAERAAKR